MGKGAVLLVSAVGLAAGVAGAQTLSVASVTGQPGQTVSVELAADAAVQKVARLQFTLDYSAHTPAAASSLAVQDASAIEPGPLFQGSQIATTLPNPTSTSVTLTGSTGINGPGTAIVIPLYIPDNAPVGAVYTLQLKDLLADDPNGNALLVYGRNGSLTVSNQGGSGPGGPALAVAVGSGSGAAGGSATIDLDATSMFHGIASLMLTLDYDQRLTAKESDVAIGDLLQGPNSVNDNVPGQLVIGIVTVKDADEPGTIARVTFHLPSDAKPGTVYPLHMTQLQAISSDLRIVNVVASDGQINIAPFAKGDVTGDGRVTVSDATMALQAAVGTITLSAASLPAADLNGDGQVSVAEVTKILRVAVGLGSF